jgi:hypothetical protein
METDIDKNMKMDMGVDVDVDMDVDVVETWKRTWQHQNRTWKHGLGHGDMEIKT